MRARLEMMEREMMEKTLGRTGGGQGGGGTTSYAGHRDASSHPTQRLGGRSVASTRWGFVWARKRYGHRIEPDVYILPMLSAFLGHVKVRR
jgi:hypothetical protein